MHRHNKKTKKHKLLTIYFNIIIINTLYLLIYFIKYLRNKMNLTTTIKSLNSKEQQEFITYLTKRNKRYDTKNIKLFKLLLNEKTNPKTIAKRLYNSDNKNAYHALRKRLLDSLIDFTANKSLKDESSIDIKIIKHILASRTFLLQKNYSIAFKILNKAEEIASENSLYALLNEIYHTKIQYASNIKDYNLEELIKKQEKNNVLHDLENRLNIFYSKLKLAVNNINQRKEIVNFETIIKEIFSNLNITLNQSLSFKSLYQIFAIVNISALKTKRYYEIESFILDSYSILKAKPSNDKQLYYQIEIVYIIANTLFRNKKFKKSQLFLNEMLELIQLKNNKYYKDFISKYTLLKALNLNFTNQPTEATLLINNSLKSKYNDTEALLDFNLCLVMFYFQQENFNHAKKIISKFYHTDKWHIEKVGIDWVIKKCLAELLLLIELNEENLFYSRLKSFKRQYTKYLKEINQTRILNFLTLAEQHYKNPEKTTSKKFKDKITTNIEWKNTLKEDIFVISFYAWLKSKTEQKPIYETTLKLLNNN